MNIDPWILMIFSVYIGLIAIVLLPNQAKK
jgi:hypothetical protein